MPPLIQLQEVNFTFDEGKPSEVKALKNISFDIHEGSYAAFFGPSGCGKTTLLYSIAGVQRPQKGKIIIDGQDINKFSPAELAIFRQTKIGIIFQSFNLLPTLTILDNVALPMTFLGVSEKDRQLRGMSLLKRFGLDYLAGRYPHELSGGQQQRVSIARALANNPLIILADEPMGNLDSKNASIVLDELRELQQKDGKTIVMVTHEVWTLRDVTKIFYMRDGVIIKSEDRTPSPAGIPIPEKKEESLAAIAVKDVQITTGTLKTPDETQEDEKKLGAIHAVSALNPELSAQEVKIRALTHLISGILGEKQRKRFEFFLFHLLRGGLELDEFERVLDRPFSKFGVGMWKGTAKRVTRIIRYIMKEWKLLDSVIENLERNPHMFIHNEVREIRKWLLAESFMPLSKTQRGRLDEIIEERIREIITREHFERILGLSVRHLGIGLKGNVPHRIAEKFETLLLKRKDRPAPSISIYTSAHLSSSA